MQAHVCLRSVSSIDVTIIVPAPAAELDLVERETISRQAPEEVKYLLEVIFYYSVQDIIRFLARQQLRESIHVWLSKVNQIEETYCV